MVLLMTLGLKYLLYIALKSRVYEFLVNHRVLGIYMRFPENELF